ncbi:MAG: FtsX-like permease family protein, partial [Spirochaetia bacterium]|nr:FtsX-like permease family protein [Spirochaetia bacterium]
MKLSFQLELIKKNINLFSFSSLSFILSIVIGVGSVTGINSYKNTLKSSILKESRNLMGADLLFESSRKLDENQLKFISDNLPKDSNITFTVQFISMLESKKSNDSAITMVKANSILFPFYGEVGTIPQNIYKNIGNNQILLDESITKNLDIKIGDVVKLGNIQFELIGFISREPLSGLGGFSGMAPTSIININSLSSTGLEQRGSRIRYNYFVTIPEKLDSFEIKKNLFSKFIKEDITIIHHTEVGSGTQKFIFNTLDYMTLLGLSAFFLGAISILITVRTRLQSKITEIAILKCLGANSFFSIKIFLSEIMLLSFIGSVLGISAGYLIQFIIPDLTSSEYLSKINPSLDFISLIWGFLIGLVVPFTLTIDSIYAIVKQSPLGAIRSETESKVKLK